MLTKICYRCKASKNISEFGTKKKKTYCLDCNKLIIKQWRINHPQKTKLHNNGNKSKIRKQKWLNDNLDKRRQYQQKYYLDNLHKFKARNQTTLSKRTKKQYKKNKRNDPVFRMRHNISNAILKALKHGKSRKAGQSILKYLRYTINDLKNHLQNQFDNQMSWNNYGTFWHIDHIIPQSDLPYTSMNDVNFYKCWSLSNLRPLNAIQNMRDGITRIRHKKV